MQAGSHKGGPETRSWPLLAIAAGQAHVTDFADPLGNRVEVHHVRALKDLRLRGRRHPPEWATRMAARHRKTLLVCRPCHEDIHYSGCPTRQLR